MKIQQLPPLLANQIAAGEVVERPASVVKELIENSLDAKSTLIEIRLKEGGKQRIQLRDNGEGIEKEDLLLALSRHATSKIKSVEDLAAIKSLGFRGEALASISAVSHLAIQSKTEISELAWEVLLSAEDLIPAMAPCGHPQGTSVLVKDLFFNTPARRKFLRSAQTELSHCDELIKRIALSRFDVAITVFNDETLYRQYPLAATMAQKEKRVAKIFGQPFIQKACFIDMSSTSLRLWGWIGLAEFSRQQSDLQYFYVNGRIIRDRVVSHAVRQAYEEKVPIGRYPAYVLYLEMPYYDVDVNVHPTKHEVRFHESRLVHDFIVSSVRKALEKTTIAPKQPILEMALETVTASYEPSKISSSSLHVAQNREKYFAFAQQAAESNPVPMPTGLPLVGVAQGQFFIYDKQDHLAVVSLSSLKKHYLSQQWLAEWFEKSRLSERLLLIPQRVTLSQQVTTFLLDHPEAFKQIGIEYNALGPQLLIIRSFPRGVSQINFEMLIAEIERKKWDINQIGQHKENFFGLLADSAEVDAKAKDEWASCVDEATILLLSPQWIKLKA